MLTRTTVPEFAEQGIRVNAICPGPTRTEMTDNLPPELIPQVVTSTPIGRFADASELANSALFLASDLSPLCYRYLSGGGWRHYLDQGGPAPSRRVGPEGVIYFVLYEGGVADVDSAGKPCGEYRDCNRMYEIAMANGAGEHLPTPGAR